MAGKPIPIRKTQQLAFPAPIGVPKHDDVFRSSIEQLPAVVERLEASLIPVSREQAAKAATMLMGQFKSANNIGSPDVFMAAMVDELADYPADILDQAIIVARRSFKWEPSIAEMVEVLEELTKDRRQVLKLATKRNEDAIESLAARATKKELQRALHQNIQKHYRKKMSLEQIEVTWNLLDEISPVDRDRWQQALEQGQAWAATATKEMAILAEDRPNWPSADGSVFDMRNVTLMKFAKTANRSSKVA